MNRETTPGIFGLLGYRIQYSLSPAIHNHIFQKYGINAVYGLFDIPPHGFRPGFNTLLGKALGFNITKPYKEEAANLLVELSREASLTGSVNLVKENRGYNTDYMALGDLVKRHGTGLEGKECTIFGSGGAARTAAFLFGSLHMYVTIINRSHEKALKLEADLSGAGIEAQSMTLNSAISHETMESAVFVNCISYPEFRFPGMRTRLAVDFNYASRSGDFRNMFSGGHSLITGEEILAAQAIHSQKIWNNIEPDFNEIMEVINVQHTG